MDMRMCVFFWMASERDVSNLFSFAQQHAKSGKPKMFNKLFLIFFSFFFDLPFSYEFFF